MSEHYFKVKAVLGIDNTSDLASVSIQHKGGGIFFREIDNVDIDDAGKPHRRPGYGSSIYIGAYVRSIWANDDIFLFPDGTTFNKLNDDGTIIALITDVDATDPFCFVEHGGIVYFSNNSIVGYIDVKTGLPYPFPTPSLPPIRTMDKGEVVMIDNPALKFKIKMVGGHILEWYNSRLLAANGANLFFSDSTVPTMMDRRKNALAFKGRLTMVKAVDSGIYVGDSEAVYYEHGTDMSSVTEFRKLDIPAIEGMSVVAPVRGKTTKKTAYWMTEKGLYAGYNDGIVKPMQEGLFNLIGLESGTAIVKDGSYEQLIMVGKFKVGYGGSTGAFRFPVSTINSISEGG